MKMTHQPLSIPMVVLVVLGALTVLPTAGSFALNGGSHPKTTWTPATPVALFAKKSSQGQRHGDGNGNMNDNDSDNGEQAAKQQALRGVLSQIERAYGRGSILRLDEARSMEVATLSSGALTLDVALGGGGYPVGRVVEIYGPESSGKTTLALHAVASSQRRGGTAAFIDAEHALDPAYARNLGVDTDQLYVSQPDSGEMALDVVDKLVRSNAVDVIVVDSVAALVPRAELEGDMSDTQIGLQARLMSKAMRKITGSLAASQCTVIFLNQLRSKVGVIYGSPEVTSGGNALKFFASIRIDTRRKELLPDNAGIRCKVKVVKNKVATPFQTVFLDILFGKGIDTYGCLVDAAVDCDVLSKKGSWYAFRGQNLAQGRANVVELIKDDQNADLCRTLEEEVRAKIVAKDYEGEDEDDNNDGDDIGVGFMDAATEESFPMTLPGPGVLE